MSVSVATVALATDAETLIEMLPDQVFVPKSVGSAKLPVGVNVPVKGITTGAIGPLTVCGDGDRAAQGRLRIGRRIAEGRELGQRDVAVLGEHDRVDVPARVGGDVRREARRGHVARRRCAQVDVKLGGKNSS